MDPTSLIGFVPSYNGDAFTLYNYINCAKQWMTIAVGNKPENVMLLLSNLEGKAAISISMVDHGFKFSNVESALKQECGDNREFNTLIIELANVKREGSYKDLIFELKQKFFFIKSNLMDKYNEQTIVEEVMNPYIHMAQNTLRNSLPYHDQIYVSNCSFNETATKILQLEAEGRFDNINQKFSNILPPPRVINNSNPKTVKPMYPQNQQNYKHINYPPTQRSINQRLQTVRPNTQQYYRQQWNPNPNNVFTRPQHQYFKQNESQKPIQNNLANETEDVSVRTGPQLRAEQIKLIK
ncbi:unnamed protein product [Leptidea sinapis]|uniref:Uncharacterized protein n=1 Tax=Leptidea sinapis TaxID=189913 RepID=A0A5E4QL69_9NEOP|nr:unnamed protein product [Leptidea sinapis]